MSFDSKEYAWHNIQVSLLGVNLQKIRGVKYGVKKDKEGIYARGENPHEVGSGNKEYEGEVTLLQSQAEQLAALLEDETEDLTDLPPFDMIVSYVPKGGRSPLTHICKNCEFKEDMREMKQGDKFQEITFPIIFLGKQRA